MYCHRSPEGVAFSRAYLTNRRTGRGERRHKGTRCRWTTRAERQISIASIRNSVKQPAGYPARNGRSLERFSRAAETGEGFHGRCASTVEFRSLSRTTKREPNLKTRKSASAVFTAVQQQYNRTIVTTSSTSFDRSPISSRHDRFSSFFFSCPKSLLPLVRASIFVATLELVKRTIFRPLSSSRFSYWSTNFCQ